MKYDDKPPVVCQSCADLGDVYICRQRLRGRIVDLLARRDRGIIRLTRAGGQDRSRRTLVAYLYRTVKVIIRLELEW